MAPEIPLVLDRCSDYVYDGPGSTAGSRAMKHIFDRCPYLMPQLPRVEQARELVAEVLRGASFPPFPPPRLAVDAHALKRN